jgi:hypothetical protein
MTTRTRVFRIGLLTGLAMTFSIHESPRAEPVTSAPSAAIGGGAPVWIDSVTDPAFALINVRVDIGTMRQVGDALEAEFAWTLRRGLLRDTQADHPDLTIPEASQSIERQRVVCLPDGPLSYRIESTLVTPDGKRIDRRVFEPDRERRKVEEWETQRGGPRLGYHRDPPSLLCWALARKCEGKPMSWPPPGNYAPLDNSERAARMNAEYNRMFVPRCSGH